MERLLKENLAKISQTNRGESGKDVAEEELMPKNAAEEETTVEAPKAAQITSGSAMSAGIRLTEITRTFNAEIQEIESTWAKEKATLQSSIEQITKD